MSIRKLGTVDEWLVLQQKVLQQKGIDYSSSEAFIQRHKDHAPRETFGMRLGRAGRGDSEPVPCPSPDPNEGWGQKLANYRGWSLWIFKGDVYEITGASHQSYGKEQLQLLIVECYDRERRKLERLKTLYGSGAAQEDLGSRERIPERVRIEVWRRDGGKCTRCGSREKLEYDHIVPVSKGGGSTSRNIELLCEKCNRGKGDRVG